MSYNDRKIVNILLEECSQIEDHYSDYKNDMKHLVAEVLNLEREHIIRKINIVQKIGDQVNTVGMSLYKNTSNNNIKD